MKRYIPLICLSLAHTLVDTCAQLVEPLWPGIRRSYGLEHMGMLSLAFVIQSLPTSLSQAVFGYIRDLRSTPWLMWVGPILGAVCMSSIGLSDSQFVLAILFILGGIGIGAFHPEAAVAAGRALPEHRTRSLSMFMLGGALGLGLGPVLSGAIVRYWGVAGLVGMIPFLVALIGLLWWGGQLGTLSPKPKSGAPRPSISEAFEGRGKLALAIFVICSLRLVPNMAVAKVLSFTLKNWGYDELETGLVQSLFLVAASAGMFLMAFRFRSGLERSFMIWCPLIGIPMLAVMGWEGCPRWLFMTMLMTSGITLWGTTPAMVSYAQQQFPNGAGMASAITMGLAWGLGGLIQAPITAHFSGTAQPQWAFFGFIPCLVLSTLGARLLPPLRESSV
ncbi:MAG: MFS transporter [Planctomycetaceae bacterium]